MEAPANYKQVITVFEKKSDDIRRYFADLESLVKGYDWHVSLSYVFSKIETVKHTALYCGLVKLHWTETTLTRDLLNRVHISRGRYKELFKHVYGAALPDSIQKNLSAAEKIRDRVAHGKDITQPEARQGLVDAFEFSEAFNGFVKEKAGVSPFGDLRGFKGRAEPLSRETTRWVLRGMGIPPISNNRTKSMDEQF